MIESPPNKMSQKQLLVAAAGLSNPMVASYVDTINSNYDYWTDVKYKKLPEGISSNEELWHTVKFSRLISSKVLWDRYKIKTSITDKMQQMCHEFDMNFGGSWGASAVGFDKNKELYLISSLMEEAISSSKMEGATTTRKLAKEMLRKKITPKDKSQQMIFNNYNTIKFIVENKDKPLSEELLLNIHALMTHNTIENTEDSGRFRTDDEVVVENGINHETVHTPPMHTEIPQFINELTEFFNRNDNNNFIHPIVKGITIHFMIGYVHPFADGNGRTARALFYWYMLRNGYWLTEYLSISRIISKSKNQYEKAYLHSENDENDIGYFITYNLKVLEKAFGELKAYIKHKIAQKNDAAIFMRLKNINERQAQIIKMFVDSPNEVLTVKDVQSKFRISPTTAKADIIGLIENKLISEITLNKVKRGYVKSSSFDNIIKT